MILAAAAAAAAAAAWSQLPPLLNGHVRPVEAAAGQQHVPNQRFYGCLPYQADKEELLDHRGGDGAQGRQTQQQLPKSGGLVGVLAPHVLL